MSGEWQNKKCNVTCVKNDDGRVICTRKEGNIFHWDYRGTRHSVSVRSKEAIFTASAESDSMIDFISDAGCPNSLFSEWASGGQ